MMESRKKGVVSALALTPPKIKHDDHRPSRPNIMETSIAAVAAAGLPLELTWDTDSNFTDMNNEEYDQFPTKFPMSY